MMNAETMENNDQFMFKKESKKRSRVAQHSYLARQKRKLELIRLREENTKLREEQFIFQEEIQNLEKEVEMDFGGVTVRDLEENAKLKEELEEHKNFVNNVLKHLMDVPNEKSARSKLYSEGADCAKNFILNLLVQCAKERWNQVVLPNPVENNQIHPSIKSSVFFRKVTNQIFGRSEFSDDGRPLERINFIGFVDFVGKCYNADAVGEVCYKLVQSAKEQCRMFNLPAEAVKIAKIEEDTPEGTQVVHYARCEGNAQNCALLINKSKEMIPRAWVEPLIDAEASKNQHGVVEATVVCAMSTSLVSDSQLAGTDLNENGKLLKSVVLYGYMIVTDVPDPSLVKDPANLPPPRTRVVYIQSFPRPFTIGVSHDEGTSHFASSSFPKVDIGTKLSHYITQVLNNFAHTMHAS